MFDFTLESADVGDGIHVLAIRGEIDLFTAPDVKRAAAEALETGARSIVVDLSETRFLDSSGLGALIGIARRVRPGGGKVVVVNTEPSTASTFTITGIDSVLPVVATREDALGTLRPGLAAH